MNRNKTTNVKIDPKQLMSKYGARPRKYSNNINDLKKELAEAKKKDAKRVKIAHKKGIKLPSYWRTRDYQCVKKHIYRINHRKQQHYYDTVIRKRNRKVRLLNKMHYRANKSKQSRVNVKRQRELKRRRINRRAYQRRQAREKKIEQRKKRQAHIRHQRQLKRKRINERAYRRYKARKKVMAQKKRRHQLTIKEQQQAAQRKIKKRRINHRAYLKRKINKIKRHQHAQASKDNTKISVSSVSNKRTREIKRQRHRDIMRQRQKINAIAKLQKIAQEDYEDNNKNKNKPTHKLTPRERVEQQIKQYDNWKIRYDNDVNQKNYKQRKRDAKKKSKKLKSFQDAVKAEVNETKQAEYYKAKAHEKLLRKKLQKTIAVEDKYFAENKEQQNVKPNHINLGNSSVKDFEKAYLRRYPQFKKSFLNHKRIG